MDLFSYVPVQEYNSALSIIGRGRKWSWLKLGVNEAQGRTVLNILLFIGFFFSVLYDRTSHFYKGQLES